MEPSIQVLFLDGIVYEKLPAAAVSKLGGKPWVKFDVNTLAQKKLGANLQQLTQNAPNDPSNVLAYLKGASNTVTKAGTATVAGVKTTHYKVSLDLDKSATTAAAKAAVAKLTQQLGSHTLPAEVWIDGQGRLRKLTLTEHPQTPAGAPSTPVSVHITETISAFGVPVHLSAPPAAQTARPPAARRAPPLDLALAPASPRRVARAMSQSRARMPGMSREEVSVDFRMWDDQRVALHTQAREQGLSLQMYLETRVFGEIRPRQRKVRRRGQENELPLSA